MTITNETSYIPPAKEKELLKNIRATITLAEAEVKHLTEVKYSLQDEIAKIQETLKSAREDQERQERAKTETDTALKIASGSLAVAQKKLTEAATEADKIKAASRTTLSQYEKREQAITKREEQVNEAQAKADAALSQAQTLISAWEEKRNRAVQVLETLQ